jgi:hypothetical protein
MTVVNPQPNNNPSPTIEQAVDQLVKSVSSQKGFSLKSVEKFLMYALGLVSLIDPSGVLSQVMREVGLGSAAGVLAAMHIIEK